MTVNYIHEPTDLQCGQAVLAMLLNTTPENICAYLNNDRETNFKEMKQVLSEHGIDILHERKQVQTKADLPYCALLSLETPRCWHWSLYLDGVFYDPEHGVLEDFPECRRKYYWELVVEDR
ncbi:MAG: hypothetical protein J1F03_01575 [Oscillospiraceae bacterium]|nr:hypothetical protein [Oscillospiraceae bacterium]